MRKAVLITIAVLLAATIYGATYTGNSPIQPPLIAHAPIRISGNEGFTKENGVVGGLGTQTDPYVIEGWEIDATGSDYGIFIENSDAYFIIRNCLIFRAQWYGIRLDNVKNGKIENCQMVNNKYGIHLQGSLNNLFYHNNLKNDQNAYDDGTNQWDNGSEGNYWSDYSGKDKNGDKLGDIPYEIPGGSSKDRYPLIEPYSIQPTKGSIDAPVIMVEFTDFQCSFCTRFALNTLPLIEEAYIKTGKVKIVFRNFAFLGPASQLAAQAGECAHEQRRFWEYHDKLFADSLAQGRSAFSKDNLKRLATKLGLDSEAFNQCLDSGKYLEEVQNDRAEGERLGVRGVPWFFINGREVVGAQPFSVFQQIIEEELKKRGKN